MKEYFVVSNSFAAPFFSDKSTEFAPGESPEQALESFAASYKHPAGLYSAGIYESSDDYHKGKDPICSWLCNHESKKRELTKDTCSYLGHGPGDFEVDGKRIKVKDPRGGKIVNWGSHEQR